MTDREGMPLAVGVILTAVATAAFAVVAPGTRDGWPVVAALGMALVVMAIGANAVAVGLSDPGYAGGRASARRARAQRRPAARSRPAVVEHVVPPAEPTGALSASVLSFPKLGSSEEQNEDAAAIGVGGHVVAVADGASSAYASGLWARLLADGYVGSDPAELAAGAGGGFVASSAGEWLSQTGLGPDAPWWEADARQRGSFAAFAGVVVSASGRWRASAVGDCCVLHLRGDELLLSFPLSSPDEFTNTPDLLTVNDPAAGTWRHTVGSLQPGDLLLVASDAVAAWILTDPTRRGRCLAGSTPDEAAALVDTARDDGTMVNDDVTVVLVTMAG